MEAIGMTGPANFPGDIFDPLVVRDEPFFSYHVFKCTCIVLDEAPLLGGVDLLKSGELEVGST